MGRKRDTLVTCHRFKVGLTTKSQFTQQFNVALTSSPILINDITSRPSKMLFYGWPPYFCCGKCSKWKSKITWLSHISSNHVIGSPTCCFWNIELSKSKLQILPSVNDEFGVWKSLCKETKVTPAPSVNKIFYVSFRCQFPQPFPWWPILNHSVFCQNSVCLKWYILQSGKIPYRIMVDFFHGL